MDGEDFGKTVEGAIRSLTSVSWPVRHPLRTSIERGNNIVAV